MPIYEYQCKECHHRLEKLQKISDAPLVACPECGQPALSKLVSAAGFRLKGGGWYETDFKDKGRRNVAGDPDKKSDDAGKGTESKDGAGKRKAGPSDGGAAKSGKAESSTASTAA